jgi:hypothetical protein
MLEIHSMPAHGRGVCRLQRLRQADHSDKTLPIMLGVLREVHQRFYAAHDAIADQAGQPVAAPASGLRASGDVKAELAKRRRAVLAGVHIVFSRCFDLRERAQDQDVWVLAEAFGGSCYEDLTPAVTHCVTRRYGTAKVNGTIKRKVGLEPAAALPSARLTGCVVGVRRSTWCTSSG